MTCLGRTFVMSEPLIPRPFRIGGLMRCCVHTLANAGPELKNEEGTVLKCKYCPESMIFNLGAWEWNNPPLTTNENKS